MTVRVGGNIGYCTHPILPGAHHAPCNNFVPCREHTDPGNQWKAGYDLGKRAQPGDQLPHPQDQHVFYHAMRAGLHPRGLTISMFMVVIPLQTS